MDATPDSQQGFVGISRPRRRVVTWFAWSIAGLCLLASLLWLVPIESYWLDLVANLGAQVLIVCLLGLLLTLLLRRRAALVALLAVLVQLTPLVRHRAAFWPRAVDASRSRAANEVRFLHYNDSSQSDKQRVYDLMEASGADVVSIISPPVGMQADVIYGRGLEDRYAGKMTREWQMAADRFSTETSAGILVARWRLRPYDCTFLGTLASKYLACVVERPADRGGPFALIAVHPRSPRNAQRWIEGNGVVEGLATLARKFEDAGLPVVVLTDLNSTPTGWRSRTACADGHLLRAKPLFEPAGTYPDLVPLNIRTNRSTEIPAVWPASIAIDDALISPEIAVTGWTAGQRLKSGHRPVLIELLIPPAARSTPNPSGR